MYNGALPSNTPYFSHLREMEFKLNWFNSLDYPAPKGQILSFCLLRDLKYAHKQGEV
jgi:hypothetical protein